MIVYNSALIVPGTEKRNCIRAIKQRCTDLHVVTFSSPAFLSLHDTQLSGHLRFHRFGLLICHFWNRCNAVFRSGFVAWSPHSARAECDGEEKPSGDVGFTTLQDPRWRHCVSRSHRRVDDCLCLASDSPRPPCCRQISGRRQSWMPLCSVTFHHPAHRFKTTCRKPLSWATVRMSKSEG